MDQPPLLQLCRGRVCALVGFTPLHDATSCRYSIRCFGRLFRASKRVIALLYLVSQRHLHRQTGTTAATSTKRIASPLTWCLSSSTRPESCTHTTPNSPRPLLYYHHHRRDYMSPRLLPHGGDTCLADGCHRCRSRRWYGNVFF